MSLTKIIPLSPYFNIARNLHKTAILCGMPYKTRGARVLNRERKYKEPEEDLNYYGLGPHKKIQSQTDSLFSKGFAKEQSSYNPPANVSEKLFSLCESAYDTKLDDDWRNIGLSDALIKFKFLTNCIKEFGKDVPNSYLCHFKQIGDVEEYFKTPVDGKLPYDAMIRDADKLPKNLHVIPSEIRFDPTTDTFFDGQTAFPERKRTIHTKRGQVFEKTIEWPKI